MYAGNGEAFDSWLESDEYRLNWRRLTGALVLSLVLHLVLAGSIYHLISQTVQLSSGHVLSIGIVRAEQAKASSQPHIPDSPTPRPTLARPAVSEPEPPPVVRKDVKQKTIKAVPFRKVTVTKAKPAEPSSKKQMTKPVADVLASVPQTPAVQQAVVSPSAMASSVRATSIRPVYAPQPVYPKPARRLGLEGRVLLGVWVSANGVPEAIVVKKSSGYESLDDSAKAGVREWRFEVQDNERSQASGWVELPVTFRLE